MSEQKEEFTQKGEFKEQECQEEKQDDFDALLDEALEDFGKPVLPNKRDNDSEPVKEATANANLWTEEFIASATQNFEATMRSLINQQKDVSGDGEKDTSETTLDLNAVSAEFFKFAEVAAKTATESASEKDSAHCLADTLQQIAKNKEEAQSIPTEEDLRKMFENLGMGENSSPDRGGEEMEGFFPLMASMLENILSKDVIYPPIKEIVDKYPDWLADNRLLISSTDFTRYSSQYDVMKQVVTKFENEKEEDSEESKAQNFEEILQLMQKLQELGQPPEAIVGGPPINYDEVGNPQLPDLSTLLGAAGFPSFNFSDSNNFSSGLLQTVDANNSSGENTQTSQQGAEQCTLM